MSARGNRSSTSTRTNTEWRISRSAVLSSRWILLKNPYKSGTEPAFYANIARYRKQCIFVHKIGRSIVVSALKNCTEAPRRNLMSRSNSHLSIVRICANFMGKVGNIIIVLIARSWSARNVCRIPCIKAWRNIQRLCSYLNFKQHWTKSRQFFWNNQRRKPNRWFSKRRKRWKNYTIITSAKKET